MIAMTNPDPLELNALIARYVTRYDQVEDERGLRWIANNGEQLDRAPDFLNGERWQDVIDGIEQQHLTASLNAQLGSLSKHTDRRAVLEGALLAAQEAARHYDHPDAENARNQQLLGLAFQPDLLGSGDDARAELYARVLRLLDRQGLRGSRTVLLDHVTFWRDRHGARFLLSQPYTSAQDVTMLVREAREAGLDATVLGPGAYDPATTAVLFRLS